MIPYNKRQDAQIVKIKDYINGKGKYVTGEGTSITLENTINTPFNNITLKGNTSQQKYSGKNQLQFINELKFISDGITSTVTKNGYQIKFDGTTKSSAIVNQDKNIQLPQTGTYYLVCQIVSGSFSSNNFTFGVNFGRDNAVTFNQKENKGIVKINATKTLGYIPLFSPVGTTFDNLVINMQVISKNELDLNFEPYVGGTASPNPDYPQDIKVVTGNNQIIVSGKNLLPPDNNTSTTINGGDYEPYVGRQDFPISLGSLELCKIGDYQDYIYKKDNKWYKHKAINKNTLNGNEKWHFGNTKTNYTNLFTSSFQNDIKMPANNNINSNTLIYCDKFSNNTNASQQWVNDTMSSVTINNGKNITFNIPNSIATTTDEFKTYLISNNITLYYVLATPIEEEITDTTLISQLNELEKAVSYDDTTNISQTNANLPFIINAEAVKKLL